MRRLQPIELDKVDVEFDFTTDCPYWDGFWNGDNLGHIGCDPDTESAALRSYHQVLWSKPLPNGKPLSLTFGKKTDYLTDGNGLRLASDSITTSFRYRKTERLLREVMKHVDWRPWIERYIRATYTIGGSIVFPKHKNSINGMRGMNPFICDRWDLTLECIRRYYAGITDYDDNPLGWVLKNDSAFFNMFCDFRGYCEFFFLQDCVSDDYKSVQMWIPTIPFAKKHPFPKDSKEYFVWMDACMTFVSKRNKRINQYLLSETRREESKRF